MLYTIATAGHIDHGKSTLVRALTGIDPDRLPEEQERQMTIELGFAWFDLSDGSEAAIIDVPGHERFVNAMITGVGTIDMVLFIVAADDGWMPQSQEHLEILDLLEAKRGFVVITKTDLVEDDWLKLIKDDVRSKIEGTFLDDSDILEFSGKDNSGLYQIKSEIERILSEVSERSHPDLPRLYIDRVFSVTGHGAVVTGTMRDGVFDAGEEVRVIPDDIDARIKSIQTHKKAREKTAVGSRAALNLSGVSHNDVARGSAIVRRKAYGGTNSIAARIQISSNARIVLNHNRDVTILIGTTRTDARVFVFKGDEFTPGTGGVCEFRFDERVLARIGDRFIIRLPTPDVLIGGGVVVDTDCERHSRTDKWSKKHYESRDLGDLRGLVMSEIGKRKSLKSEELLANANIARSEVKKMVAELLTDSVVKEHRGHVYLAEQIDKAKDKLANTVLAFHKQHPARRGIRKTDLISKSKLDLEIAEAALDSLEQEKVVSASGALVHEAGFSPQLKPEHRETRDRIVAMFKKDPQNPPSVKEIEKLSLDAGEVIEFMRDSGELVELPEGLALLGEDFERVKQGVRDKLKAEGKIVVRDIRDMFGYSRKYAVPILEKLDSIRMTRRVGDHRVLID